MMEKEICLQFTEMGFHSMFFYGTDFHSFFFQYKEEEEEKEAHRIECSTCDDDEEILPSTLK